jgi:hypothetical protein
VTSGKNLLPRKKTLATTDFLEMTLGAIGCWHRALSTRKKIDTESKQQTFCICYSVLANLELCSFLIAAWCRV